MASNITRLALVISQEEFELPGVKDREGNEHDVKQLESTLTLLGFFVRKFENLKKQEILSTLTSICVESYKNLECILVIVLSHGDSGGVLYAKDQEFYTKDVWGPFRDSSKFNDIPKVFIFQACRGINEEKTFLPKSPTKPQSTDTFQMVPVLPQTSGFLLVHSTIAGHISKRNHETGTIFIQTLCNEMIAFHNKYGEINFLSLLTEVNNKVSTSADGEQGSQTSTFTSFMRQPLILRTTNAVDAEKYSTSQVSNDSTGGDIKTSYENEGTNLILILYTEKYEEQYEIFKRVLNYQHFTIKSILINNLEDIYGLRGNIFENACSFTAIVFAEMLEDKITDYCEKISVKFCTFSVRENDIWYQFTASQCDHLRGKPKLFFFIDLLERKDSTELNSHQGFENIVSVNNHSDFLWAYCYGKRMFEEIKRALTDPCEEITHLLTTAMRRADSTACSQGGRSSHFESTLRLQFHYRSSEPEIEDGDTDLHIATRKGHVKTMQLILQRDQSSLNLPNNIGSTPLHLACFHGKTEAAKLLLSYIDDNSLNICDEYENSFLHIAARIGDVNIMQLILQRDRSLLNMQNTDEYTPLYTACEYGKTEAVKFLLFHKDCSVKIGEQYGNTALHVASNGGVAEIMKLILQRDQSLLNMQNEDGYTPLHKACEYGKTEAVKLLLSRNDCSVNICDTDGDTVLHIASRKGAVKTMQLILQRDQSLLNIQNEEGCTPLHTACYNGKTKSVKLLLSYNDCSVNICDNDGDTALHDASCKGYVEILQILLQRDQSHLNMRNDSGQTPLHYACRNGKTEAVKFLLSHNDCSVNICDKYGNTVLHDSSRKGYIEIMQIVLNRDQSLLNMQNKDEYTPLHEAFGHGKSEAVKFLLSHTDCSVNICDKDHGSYLHLASYEGDVEIMQLILQHEQSLLNMQNSIGHTPLHIACNNGKTGTVKFLLSHTDCSVNICSTNGSTVLHSASNGGYVEIMQLILQRNKSLLNMQDKEGYTPLHGACYNGKTDAAKLLLSQSDCLVNTHDLSNSRRTALDIAKEYRHDEIVKLLRQHGAEGKSQCACM